MGQWGFGVMEGDDADDVRIEFETRFGEGKPSPEQAIHMIKTFDPMDPEGTVGMAVCWLMMSRAAKFSDELRYMGNQAIDMSLDTIEELGWKEPEKRIAALEEFRETLLCYPNEGEAIELTALGVLDAIASKL